jgi:hypothetical protein
VFASRRRGRLAGAALGTGLRQTEVQHLDFVVWRDLDVRGLEIAVHDALLVRRFQRVGDLMGDRECVF